MKLRISVEISNANDVTTKFVDWVEKDFLDLDKWSVKRVTLDNYEVNLAQGQLKRDTLHLSWIMTIPSGNYPVLPYPIKKNLIRIN